MGDNETASSLTADAADLLQRKGTIEILTEIGSEGPQRHTDLRQELLLSSSTIQQRLKNGKECDLWEQQLEDRSGVAAKVYALTDLGEEVYGYAEAEGLDTMYRIRRGLIRELENAERRVIINSSPKNSDWIRDIEIEDHDTPFDQSFINMFK
jgi:DNA-binding HxlR family transcriptional regulator